MELLLLYEDDHDVLHYDTNANITLLGIVQR